MRTGRPERDTRYASFFGAIRGPARRPGLVAHGPRDRPSTGRIRVRPTRLGTRLGLDAAGIGETRALGESTFTVGKQVSPRLFVSYGVSLIGTGQVLTLKYLLRRGLDVSLESGSVETAGSLNWRKEK